ncbi:TRADD-N-associated membrane domain-containing protein [Fusobacterium mortiferum]|uniref:TRADD-N-associated membrane domain-containing protein n=1 Tax=Fusobacterium mortiferum TaxID=850 RepID=UPI00356A45FA
MEDKKLDDDIFNKSKVLNQQLDYLKKKEKLNKGIRFLLSTMMLISILLIILIVSLVFFKKESILKKESIQLFLNSEIFKWILIISITPLLFFLLFFPEIFFDRNLIFDKIKETSDELEYLNIEDESDIKKAEKQFKLHQNELQKYYSQNLSHSQKIFYTGIVCIILGFGIIAFTMWILSTKNINNTLELMITGGIGGVLSNFIGVIYLKMYSETLKVLIEFHNKLVYTHNLHFSNYLLAKVENKELKEKILQEAILAIVKKEKLD